MGKVVAIEIRYWEDVDGLRTVMVSHPTEGWENWELEETPDTSHWLVYLEGNGFTLIGKVKGEEVYLYSVS